ncbi:hypothetical protein KRR40_28895 [Niabella defluvii]|nr:hypothetical protein KRR40_28895 [Niabella sp. I65]
MDHFSKTATANYFKAFDTAFGNSSHGVKGFFNDSYEVYGANWTPEFFNEFNKRRGYDLKPYINALFPIHKMIVLHVSNLITAKQWLTSCARTFRLCIRIGHISARRFH